ncbi:uncharacterized protein LOC121422770 [Lytechinus variegatus]|uniref:uncharacterized protein LOC121422770 n=1 Tax=Lytechinus variegatus TaxID=7654 RepID=UPI001BB20B4F|nr:uncharacterized protein LOC121422770 [Lytechinus variegatus]XP_041473887.1 uncharacterized protein LOC121422770 [Lytechinus variegatus]
MCDEDGAPVFPSTRPNILQAARCHGDATRMRSKPPCVFEMVASVGFLLLIIGCLVVVVGGGRRPRGPAGLVGLFIISTGFSLLMVCCIWGYCFKKRPDHVRVEDSGNTNPPALYTSSAADDHRIAFGAQTVPIQVLSHDGAVILIPRNARDGHILYHHGNGMTNLGEAVHYNVRYNSISLPSYDQAMSCPVLLPTSRSHHHQLPSTATQDPVTPSEGGHEIEARRSNALETDDERSLPDIGGHADTPMESHASQTTRHARSDLSIHRDRAERTSSRPESHTPLTNLIPHSPPPPPLHPPPAYQSLLQ